ETGNMDDLPARTFLRGFVHSYASYLRMDTDKVMQVFQEELGPTTQENQDSEDLAAQVISGKTLPATMDSSRVFRYSAVAGIIALIVIVIGVKQLVEKYEREKEVEPPPATLEALQPAEPQEAEPMLGPAPPPPGEVSGTENSAPAPAAPTPTVAPAPSAA